MRRVTADRVCLTLLIVWLIWLPLPYGSNIVAARTPLVAIPLFVCVAAAILRLMSRPWKTPARAWWMWTTGGALFILVGTLQLVPLPLSVLDLLSPASHAIWSAVERLESLARGSLRPAGNAHTISVNPMATAAELVRIMGLLATFLAASLLIRSARRRTLVTASLAGAGAFEAVYGLRQAALENYDVWGWHNGLIYGRITGTFVNPNHYGHYLAITSPFAILLAVTAWHDSAPGAPFRHRLAQLVERRILLFATAAFAAAAGLAAILLAQSRGALLALAGGLFTLAVITSLRTRAVKNAPLRNLALTLILGSLAFLGLALYLGRGRTIARFQSLPSEQITLGGRRVGMESAAALWMRFPTFGSGLGTFADVVSMTQREDVSKLYHHAHNDYLELAATAGALGATIAVVSLLGGYVALTRSTFARRPLMVPSWNRRAFQTAALASITVAMIHAMFDFNFFIPANAATIALIAGAAVSLRESSARSRADSPAMNGGGQDRPA